MPATTSPLPSEASGACPPWPSPPTWPTTSRPAAWPVASQRGSHGPMSSCTSPPSTTLAPDIRVNSFTPGGVYRGHPDTFRHAYEQRTPLGRMASEEDYIGAVVYLASDLSSYVTGHNLVVDGGWTAW